MTVKPTTDSAKSFDLHELIHDNRDQGLRAFPTLPRWVPLILEKLVYRLALW